MSEAVSSARRDTTGGIADTPVAGTTAADKTATKETAANKVELDFQELTRRLKALALPQVDHVVGIASGGIVPASLAAFHLGVPLSIIQLNFRDEENRPQREAPTLLEPFQAPPAGSRVLLVDDVSVSGATMEVAKGFLRDCRVTDVTTLAFKGRADHVIMPEVASCVIWPWKPVHR